MMTTIICFTLAAICLVMSILQFKQKGFCFNNAYIYAPKEEQEKMKKGPYYRQSAIVFLFIFVSFVVLGIYTIVHVKWLLILQKVVLASALIYAVVSNIARRTE